MLDEALDSRRERHVVLRDLEEPRPAALGDQLTVQLEAFLDGTPLDEREEGTPPRPSTIVLDPKRLAPGLAEALVGAEIGETVETTSHMPEDHPNERVRDKDVQFEVLVQQIQERLLPDWDELPTLEEFEGSLDELREKTRQELVEAARESAEREVVDTYIARLVEQSHFDLPEVLVEREADRILHQQEYEQYERYGVKAEQVYKLQNRDRDELVQQLLPQGEARLKINLALREVVQGEQLQIDNSEIDSEVDRLVEQYEEAQRERARTLLSTELRGTVANNILDKKLRDRLIALATGAEVPSASTTDTPTPDADATAQAEQSPADAAPPAAASAEA
jgi:trigger factor